MENTNEWQLFHLAQALTRAKRLEKHREDFYEELYESILYPTVHYDKEFTGNMGNPSVDTQAIKIIEAKERYNRKIQREYDRHVRWRELLEWASDKDRLIMIRYFEKKKSVQPKIIIQLLSRIEEYLEKEEKRIERERSENAIAEFKNYQELTSVFRKPNSPFNLVVKDNKQRQRILNRRYVFTAPH